MRALGRRYIWGLAFILVGIFFLSETMGVSGVRDIVRDYWPLIFVLIAVGEFIELDYYSGVFWLIIGVVVTLFTAGWVSYSGNIWEIIWPLVIILIGLRFIIRPFMRPRVEVRNDSGSAAVFSGTEKKISAKDFKSTSTTAVFGGAKIDLREAKVDKNGAVIDVDAVFGGVEIIVPKKTPVKSEVTSIFGGVSDKRTADEIDDKLPVIVIRGEAIFGGVEIKD